MWWCNLKAVQLAIIMNQALQIHHRQVDLAATAVAAARVKL
jgi:hypothetical protein